MNEKLLFNIPRDWEAQWQEMPKFYPPTRDTVVRNKIDVSEVKKINLSTPTSKLPHYPVYIVSKGRWRI